ncbi:MAG TPA: endonuclease/exonuclease/phosphatase family protein [Thermoanaerobaculia bacterium]|nr:endonuclease/exonuclease/phosphatase family protein [Thermoanaerobaculia bacterium]
MSWTKRILLWCVFVVILLFAYRLIFIYRWRAGDCDVGPQPRQTAQKYPPHLLVMTYNIEGDAELLKGHNHVVEIARVINAVKPDIVGLNEVHRHTWQSRFDDQIGDLQQMTHMNGVFGRSYNELGGAFGNAVLTRGEIIAADVHNLPSSGEPRSLLVTTIRIDGVTINFDVAHVASWGGLNSEIRGRQLDCVARHVRVNRYPHVLTGDFNADPSADEIKEFRRASTTLAIAGESLPDTQRVMKRRIDYIFADLGWQVRNVQVLDVGPSDHRPVIAELVHAETH